LNGKPYTKASDIYSFGVIMAELSSGKPPFHDKKHDFSLSLAVCNGLRPEFGKGTPEFYKKLAYECMKANPDQRPTVLELKDIFYFWLDSNNFGKNDKRYGNYGIEIKKAFAKADEEIPNISDSYKMDPEAVYKSRAFTFSNLPKPINSSLITSYIQKEDNNQGNIIIFIYNIFIIIFL